MDNDFNQAAHDAWETNAAFWDERMGEGNDFQKLLVEPAADRLLEPRAGQRILEIGCGNGLYARHLATIGVSVLATDFSEAMLEHARARTDSLLIEYRRLDATESGALAALEPPFDAVVCNMAIMDIAVIQPLFTAVPNLLVPGGRFVFTILHPCFNSADTVLVAERSEGDDGRLHTAFSAKISTYLGASTRKGIAMEGQPVPHWYFNRPLHVLVGTGFAAGLAVTGLEEPGFPAQRRRAGDDPSWDKFSEIPPVLAVRMEPHP